MMFHPLHVKFSAAAHICLQKAAVGCIKKRRMAALWGCHPVFGLFFRGKSGFCEAQGAQYAVAYYACMPVKLWYSNRSGVYYAQGSCVSCGRIAPGYIEQQL